MNSVDHCLLTCSCRYLNAIQTMCPHILRYLTTAVITNKRRRTVLKDLVKVIQQESYTYRDPITEFLECLYVNFDFDGAQKKLRECEQVSVVASRALSGVNFDMTPEWYCTVVNFARRGNQKQSCDQMTKSSSPRLSDELCQVL